jgi:3-dehydroquinate synthase
MSTTYKKALIAVSKLYPKINDLQKCLLIFDSALTRDHSAWLRKFPRQISVKSGEEAKSLASYSGLIEKVLSLTEGVSRKDLRIVVCGGGSIGDLGGFIASTLFRGVRLIHVPTTLLAAVDSAHGGKNALNSVRAKNQIGTFYFPEQVLISRKFLATCSQEQIKDGQSEALKVLLLSPIRFRKTGLALLRSEKMFLDHVDFFAKLKMNIVVKDPFETLGLRQRLNLGHTLGHVIEKQLGLSHGLSVNYGLRFALELSRALGLIDTQFQRQIAELEEAKLLVSLSELSVVLRSLSQSKKSVLALLGQDKKRTGATEVNFILLKSWGKTVVRRLDSNFILRKILEDK